MNKLLEMIFACCRFGIFVCDEGRRGKTNVKAQKRFARVILGFPIRYYVNGSVRRRCWQVSSRKREISWRKYEDQEGRGLKFSPALWKV